MKIRTNNTLLIVVNLIMTVVGIAVLYFTSLFWMGSQKDYQELVNKSYWYFFANRLLFNLLIGLAIILVIGFINWLVQKITKAKMGIRKVLMIDFLIFTICSIAFIALQLS
ncbi:hypothetical protein [Echinicola pacifica]|nr:hypothetical protein [Echinicola pacifica]